MKGFISSASHFHSFACSNHNLPASGIPCCKNANFVFFMTFHSIFRCQFRLNYGNWYLMRKFVGRIEPRKVYILVTMFINHMFDKNRSRFIQYATQIDWWDGDEAHGSNERRYRWGILHKLYTHHTYMHKLKHIFSSLHPAVVQFGERKHVMP